MNNHTKIQKTAPIQNARHKHLASVVSFINTNSTFWRNSLLTAIILMTSLVPVKSAPAADVYDANGFESSSFTEGPLVGQDNWEGVPPLSPNAAKISTDSVFSGGQGVIVRGVKLEHQDFINEITSGYYDAIGSYRRPVDYNVGSAGFPVVRIQADVRVNGPLDRSEGNFFSASIAARGARAAGGTAGIGELAISSDGRVYGYSGYDDVPTFLASAPITLGEWHVLAIDLDFLNRTYSFFVDGGLLGGPYSFHGDADTNVLTRGSLIAYAAPDTQKRHKSSYGAFFDNFTITSE